MFRRALPVLALVLAGCGKTPPTDDRPSSGSGPVVEVNAEGATFVEPVMKVWANEYLEKTGDRVRINYQGKGSGAGIGQMTRSWPRSAAPTPR